MSGAAWSINLNDETKLNPASSIGTRSIDDAIGAFSGVAPLVEMNMHGMLTDQKPSRPAEAGVWLMGACNVLQARLVQQQTISLVSCIFANVGIRLTAVSLGCYRSLQMQPEPVADPATFISDVPDDADDRPSSALLFAAIKTGQAQESTAYAERVRGLVSPIDLADDAASGDEVLHPGFKEYRDSLGV